MACVLVVDDVKFISMMLAEILAKAGHEVEVAANGLEAIDKAAASTPDLVVLDISMPGMDGIEVTRKLRAEERTSEVPILMVTARTDEKSRSAAVAAGANDYVVKPFDSPALLAKVAKLIKEAKPAVPSPAKRPSRRILGPGVEVEDHPKALVVKFKLDEVTPETLALLEPELTSARRGILLDWRSPDIASADIVERIADRAARLALDGVALRIARAPDAVLRAFEDAGHGGLLLSSVADS